MKEIKLEINRLQYPMENLKIPRGQTNKNQSNPIHGKQQKGAFASYTGGDAPTEAPKNKLKK
jgi:hypothetical protein